MEQLVQPGDGASQQSGRPWETLGVALSGGGVRAAFYALGGLMYLVRSGLNRKVRLVSSVSGGSIVNVAVAMAGDFSESDPKEFDRLVGIASHRMAKSGVFFWPGLKQAARSIIIFMLWAPVFIGLMNVVGVIDGWPWDIFWFGEIWYTGLMTVFLLGYTIVGRQRIQQEAYHQFLVHMSTGEKKSHRRRSLAELPASAVAHVLCATELTSGQPMYMSREMAFSPVYGRGGSDLALAKAIYASAAFPIGFPPLRLRSANLNMAGGRDEEAPKWLLLSDGGVFNNLGTDAFAANDSAAQIYLPDPALPIIPNVDLQMIINASSPSKKASISSLLVWRTIPSTVRIMSVLYENTLRPRMQRLMEAQSAPGGPIVVDISESPVELVDRLAKGRTDADPVRVRALEMRAILNKERSDYEWKTYADRAAQTKTVLSAVGSTAAVRLLRLGYLDTAIACHAHLGTQGIGAVPMDKWFKDLVDNKLSDDLPAVETAEDRATV
ncbi:patatin-like phospholipase family protein [Kribbella soli]|nr:patatin-like phospholipase family protein [Kribbella soli]